MSTVVSILLGIFLFSMIIVFHELGHFIAARKNGIKVNEFMLGMGPKIFSFKKGETVYSFRLFLIGGACQMLGEEARDMMVDDHSVKTCPEKLSQSPYKSALRSFSGSIARRAA